MFQLLVSHIQDTYSLKLVKIMTLVCVRPHFSKAEFLFSYPVFNFPKVFFFVVVVAKEKRITLYLCTLWNSVSNENCQGHRKEIQGEVFENQDIPLIFRFQSGELKVRWERGIRNLPREANLAVALGGHTGSHGTGPVTAQRALLSLL